MKIVYAVVIALLLTGCSGVSNKTLDYHDAQSQPGYGFIQFDFSKAKPLLNVTADQIDYTVHYADEGRSLFVDVKGATFKNRVLKAYIPLYKGYRFRSVSPYLLQVACKTCHTSPVNIWPTVYAVSEVGGTWCKETEYLNRVTFDWTNGCKGDWRDKGGIEGSKQLLGRLLITPRFHPQYLDSFTNRAPSGHQSAGS
ncbi:hypothetical protein CIG19_11095 [Enterobacterales bacterium CwR94]|nr:hypothetical protein CIG19_11095 [Enterobacterales bacterium CwR94]